MKTNARTNSKSITETKTKKLPNNFCQSKIAPALRHLSEEKLCQIDQLIEDGTIRSTVEILTAPQPEGWGITISRSALGRHHLGRQAQDFLLASADIKELADQINAQHNPSHSKTTENPCNSTCPASPTFENPSSPTAPACENPTTEIDCRPGAPTRPSPCPNTQNPTENPTPSPAAPFCNLQSPLCISPVRTAALHILEQKVFQLSLDPDYSPHRLKVLWDILHRERRVVIQERQLESKLAQVAAAQAELDKKAAAEAEAKKPLTVEQWQNRAWDIWGMNEDQKAKARIRVAAQKELDQKIKIRRETRAMAELPEDGPFEWIWLKNGDAVPPIAIPDDPFEGVPLLPTWVEYQEFLKERAQRDENKKDDLSMFAPSTSKTVDGVMKSSNPAAQDSPAPEPIAELPKKEPATLEMRVAKYTRLRELEVYKRTKRFPLDWTSKLRYCPCGFKSQPCPEHGAMDPMFWGASPGDYEYFTSLERAGMPYMTEIKACKLLGIAYGDSTTQPPWDI